MPKNIKPILFALLFSAWVAVSFASSQPLLIAVAADFSGTLNELSVPFQKQTGITIVQSSGDTGSLTQQILHGAPYDIFLSADVSHPEVLEEAGKIVPGSRVTYAVGSLVLYAPGEAISRSGMADLKAGKWSQLAMANPDLAPYGVAAQQVLAHIAPGSCGSLRDHRATKTKPAQLTLTTTEHAQPTSCVLGQNIGQTFAYVKSGAVPAGFVALSQVIDLVHHSSSAVWVIPQNLYSPIEQQAVILSTTQHLAEAQQFMTFLKTKAAQNIMMENGYSDIH